MHVNSMLQELRRKGLIATSGTRVHALDWPNYVVEQARLAGSKG